MQLNGDALCRLVSLALLIFHEVKRKTEPVFQMTIDLGKHKCIAGLGIIIHNIQEHGYESRPKIL